VDRAKAEFPDGYEEPVIDEVAAMPNPDLVVSFSGEGLDERELFRTATYFQKKIESAPLVMDAPMVGDREEVVEVIIDPARLEYYNLTAPQLLATVRANNLLVPAGEYDAASGRFGVKIQGLLETREDVVNLPVVANDAGVVTLGEVARVRRTFKEPEQITRMNGRRNIAIEIYKRTGESTVEAVDNVKAVIDANRDKLGAVRLDYFFDSSAHSRTMVNELQGNIITAVVLVLIVVVAAMGVKYGLLVSFGIPFSLLGTIAVIYLLGYTFNFMVMFGLLLALGMLIDGAVVIVEFAERQFRRGMTLVNSYLLAVRRMAPPVIASTATTLAVFIPLLFWPGIAGDFMSYLPVTVSIVLLWSLLYALLFAPVLGVALGRLHNRTPATPPDDEAQEQIVLDSDDLSRPGRWYAGFMERVLDHPLRTLVLSLAALVAIYAGYGTFGKGLIFFTETENQYGYAYVRARGNLRVEDMDVLARPVAERIEQIPGVKAVFAVAGRGGISLQANRDKAKDEIASILIELEDADRRNISSRAIFARIREAIQGFPGIITSVEMVEGGPPVGKDIQIQVGSEDEQRLYEIARLVRSHLDGMAGLRDVEDTLPLPGIEWRMVVDRPRAAMAGIDVSQVGQMLQLVTQGIRVGEYRPDDAEEEVEIRVRFPAGDRTLEALDWLKVTSPRGPVSPAAFVDKVPQQRVDSITRIDQTRVILIKANAAEGVLADNKVKEIRQWLDTVDIPPGVAVQFRGANEEQAEGTAFLSTAFTASLFLMLVLLVLQFNSFYQAALILSAVIMSTAGVLLGLLLTGKPFSVIMTGTGIVALAGIVVNNNIVLIDTYNFLRGHRPELSRRDAAHLSAVLRLRPVLLTTVTTIVGLLPLANGVSIDFVQRNIEVGGMVASWWAAMSSAIVHGLTLATLLTLVVTPAMLLLPEIVAGFIRLKFGGREPVAGSS
jgi:multidrug efflux pump